MSLLSDAKVLCFEIKSKRGFVFHGILKGNAPIDEFPWKTSVLMFLDS